jgi:hypothetical protein
MSIFEVQDSIVSIVEMRVGMFPSKMPKSSLGESESGYGLQPPAWMISRAAMIVRMLTGVPEPENRSTRYQIQILHTRFHTEYRCVLYIQPLNEQGWQAALQGYSI